MAGVLTDAGERELLDLIFGLSSSGVTAHRYLGLSTTAWNDAGTGGTEPTDSAYARRLVNISPYQRETDIQNTSTITFPTATEDWGTIAYWALFPDTSSTTPRLTGSLDVSRVCNTGDSIVITPDQIDFTIGSDDADNFIQYFFRQRYLYAMIDGVTTMDYSITSDGTAGTAGYTNNNSFSTSSQGALPSFLTDTNTRLSIGLLTTDPSSISTQYYTDGRISREGSNHYDYLSNVYDYGIARYEPHADISSGNYPHNLTTASNSLSKSGTGYARQTISFNSASTSSGVTSVSNSNTITFPTSTSSWGTVYGWAIFANRVNQANYTLFQKVGSTVADAYQSAEVFHHLHPIVVGKFNTSRTVNTNDVFRINAGDLVIRFD